MKFYDLEWLATKCGTDNKYEITAKIAAEARRESEEFPAKEKDSLADERFISNVLLEIEEDKIPLSVNYKAPDQIPAVEVFESSSPDESQKSQELQAEIEPEIEEKISEPETETKPETETEIEN